MTTVTVETRVEGKRGCGYRKKGGIYFVSDGVLAPCGRMPVPLDVCPTCHGGIKPVRGWTWVQGDALLADRRCRFDKAGLGASCPDCAGCAMATLVGRVGLLWIGESFYPTPADFLREAKEMGVSRRISAVPKDFKVGETIVWMAHRKAIPMTEAEIATAMDANEAKEFTDADHFKPGVIFAFRPSAVEYVVKGTETEEQLERLVERGLTPVRVVNPTEEQSDFTEEDDGEG